MRGENGEQLKSTDSAHRQPIRLASIACAVPSPRVYGTYYFQLAFGREILCVRKFPLFAVAPSPATNKFGSNILRARPPDTGRRENWSKCDCTKVKRTLCFCFRKYGRTFPLLLYAFLVPFDALCCIQNTCPSTEKRNERAHKCCPPDSSNWKKNLIPSGHEMQLHFLLDLLLLLLSPWPVRIAAFQLCKMCTSSSNTFN